MASRTGLEGTAVGRLQFRQYSFWNAVVRLRFRLDLTVGRSVGTAVVPLHFSKFKSRNKLTLPDYGSSLWFEPTLKKCCPSNR